MPSRINSSFFMQIPFDILGGEEAIPIQENSIWSDCSEGKVAEAGRATVSLGAPSLPWAQ